MRKIKIPTTYIVILTLSLASSVLSGIFYLLSSEDNNLHVILFNTLLISIPVALAELITIVHQFLEKKDIECCAYKEQLQSTGILKVYEKRNQEYVDDLSYDLEHLGGICSEPVKMIGVSLAFYFKDEELISENESIASKIRTKVKKYDFHILLCNENNDELIRRNELTQAMGYTRQNDKEVKTDIQADIEQTISILKNWIREDGELKFKLKKYLNAPYATIVFINDKIYYTPNPPYEKRKYNRKEKRNPNPALMIQRDSLYGRNLEKLFDKIWGADVANADKFSHNVSLV